MTTPPATKLRGILNPQGAERHFALSIHPPAEELAFFVEHYWIIDWDLRGQPPFTQEILPYPCVNLVFEKDYTRIFGVDSGKFARRLEEKGRVFGVKFRPGAFYPFLKSPVSQLTDSSMRLGEVFGMDYRPVERGIIAENDQEAQITFAETFLREFLPKPDKNIMLVNEVIECITHDRTVTKVENLVSSLGLSKRSLQRLFNQYVGGSPKWVIQRYRLHDATEHLAAGAVEDWSQLALELGYFDQAHFIKDFKTVVGKTPAEYARQVVED